jgi:hypothetical protein
MHSLEQVVEIRVLARRGKTIKQIAREAGLSRNTVRKYIRTKALPIYGPRAPRAVKLDPYKDYLGERVEADHQDSTIDPRKAFDIQLMYYPHDVTADTGGTRFLPGSHLRVESEAAIERYQNVRGEQHVVCPAGTLLVLHHGIWHGGGINRSDRLRYMFKIRICPTGPQHRLWDTGDLPETPALQRPIFWTGVGQNEDSLAAVLSFLRNALDEEYRYWSLYSLATGFSGTAGPPRTWGVELFVNF